MQVAIILPMPLVAMRVFDPDHQSLRLSIYFGQRGPQLLYTHSSKYDIAHDHTSVRSLPKLLLGKSVVDCTYCDRSSIRVCKLLFSTQERLRSAHRLQGGPLPSMRHLICAIVIKCQIDFGDTRRTFCFRHDAHAFTLRDTTGTVVSTLASCILDREAGGAASVPFST